MNKYYCDVCGVVTAPGRRRAVVEVEQILDSAGLVDVCCDCMEKARQVPWAEVIREAIRQQDGGRDDT